MAALVAAGGKPRVPVTADRAGAVALAWRDGKERRLLAANVTPAPVAVALSSGLRGRVLDTTSFDTAANDPSWLTGGNELMPQGVTLGAYAVLYARG
jgi:hypothetical protein